MAALTLLIIFCVGLTSVFAMRWPVHAFKVAFVGGALSSAFVQIVGFFAEGGLDAFWHIAFIGSFAIGFPICLMLSLFMRKRYQHRNVRANERGQVGLGVDAKPTAQLKGKAKDADGQIENK